VKVFVSTLFLEDWQPAREDWEGEVENDQHSQELSAVVRSTCRKLREATVVRRGRGNGVWVDLTEAEADWLHGEARYRWEFWLTDNYGVEDRSTGRGYGLAAMRLAELIEKR